MASLAQRMVRIRLLCVYPPPSANSVERYRLLLAKQTLCIIPSGAPPIHIPIFHSNRYHGGRYAPRPHYFQSLLILHHTAFRFNSLQTCQCPTMATAMDKFRQLLGIGWRCIDCLFSQVVPRCSGDSTNLTFTFTGTPPFYLPILPPACHSHRTRHFQAHLYGIPFPITTYVLSSSQLQRLCRPSRYQTQSHSEYPTGSVCSFPVAGRSVRESGSTITITLSGSGPYRHRAERSLSRQSPPQTR